LWHKSQIYVIDVSQSVETDHPAALDFLRKDASNVNDYFSKFGKLNVMTTRQLFEFITTVIDTSNNDENESTIDDDTAEMEYLERIMKQVENDYKRSVNQSEQERRVKDQQNSVDEAVFMSSFLPRSLNQVADYEIRQLENGEVEETYAHAVAALTGNQEVVEAYKNYKAGEGIVVTDNDERSEDVIKESDGQDDNGSLSEEYSDEGNGSDSSDDDEDDDESEDGYVKTPKTKVELEAEKADLRASRRANKKAVKEAQAEKRQTKIKKKDKKRAIKKAKAGNRKNK
jgi:RIO kinase 1